MRNGSHTASASARCGPTTASTTTKPTRSSIRNAAETVSRTTAGRRPRPPSQSASGGPFVVVDVVRTPAEKPATPAVARPGVRRDAGARRRSRWATSTHTITPIATRSTSAGSTRTSTAPMGNPGSAASIAGRRPLQSTARGRRSAPSTSTLTQRPRISSSATARRAVQSRSPSPPGALPRAAARRRRRRLFLDVRGAPIGAEHEIALPVGDVIERHGRERLEERHARLRDKRVLDPPVDHDDVALLERLGLAGDRHRHLALEDHHDLLGVLVRVQRHLLAGLVRRLAKAHLLAADRSQVDAGVELGRRHVVPGAEGTVAHQTPRTSRNGDDSSATVMTLMSSSKTTVLPSRRGASEPAALACRARSTRSGVAGCCGTQTP